MADLKITGLPSLPEGSVQGTDVLAVADLSATETKKITVKDLIAAGVALIDSGDIPAIKVATPFAANSVATATIQDDAVTAAKLATDSVTADAVAANAIGASELANNAVDSGALAANSVITSKITDANVTTDKLADNAITTVKITDANVTYAKLNLSNGDIPGAKITGNSITNAQIGADAVGSSELANNAVDTAAIADSAVTNAKLANSTVSLGGVSIALGSTDATPAFNLTDATNYPAASLSGTIGNAQLTGSITGDKLANTTIAYAKLNLSDGDIPGAKITGNSITAAQIGANAVTASELADDAVDTAAVADAAITSAKIAANTITAGNLAANSVGASELADNAVDTAAIVNGAITTDKIADGAITTAKLDGTIAASSIADNSVTNAKIAANAVGASELADNAVDTAAIAASAVTDAKVASGISGTKLGDGTITAAKLNTSNIDRSLNVASGNLGINNSITAGTRSGITFNAQGLILSTVALGASDLPIATSSAVGGVSVGTGLSVNGSGVLALSNSVTAATVSGITFNSSGQITAATALTSAHLPIATTSAKGAVQITSGGGLSVDGSGNLTTATSGISAGTYQSITVNNKGVATAGAALTEGLIPSLPASKITSGTLDAARIGADTIDSSKLSNSSTTIIQSIAQLGYPTAAFTGQLLFDPIAEDAYLWDGNAWNPITTLTKGALVRLGTYNASTSKVDYVTSAGAAAGLTVGANLPAASSAVDGGYVVVSVQGTPSGVAGITGVLKPPDYLLGVTNTAGSNWVEIDLSTTVASQVASAIGYTPYGQIAATNVQAAIDELETEKVAKAGSTITGELLIGNTGSLVFEGATADAFETTLTVADPTTSDKTITLPNVTGTVITSGDTGTVTGTMLANDTIQNVDIKSDAAIAFSKLAALTSAQILVGNGSNVATGVAVTGDISINNAGLTAIASGVIVDGDISGSAAITGSKVTTGTTSAVGVLQLTDSTSSTSTTTAGTPNAIKSAYDLANTANTTASAALPKAGGTMTGNLILDNAKEVRFSEGDGDGSNYTGIKAQAQSADIVLTLPATAPTTGQVLKAGSTATTLEWAADSSTDSTKLPLAGGTLTGNLILNAQSDVRFADADSSNYVALQSPATVGTSFTLTLPAADGSSGQALISDGSGNLSFSTVTTAAAGSNTQVQFNNSGAFAGSSSLTFNSGTGALTATSFVGNVTGNLTGNVTGNTSGSAGSCTGNAATATALASSVNIGGVSFDGTSSISLPGVNASGTQDTSGTAALATQLTVTANNSTDETVYPLFVDAATGSQGAETDTGLSYNPSTGLLTSTGFSGAGTSLTALNASNLSSGTVNVARLGSGSSVSTKFLRGDNTWQTISSTPEGTAILSTGESGGTKFLREDGDGTCSWQAIPAAAAGTLTGTELKNTVVTSSLTSVGTLTGLTVDGDVTLTGANYSAVWDKSDNALEFGNNAKIKVGSDSDLNIYHDGNSYIDNAEANQLAIQSDDLKLRSHTNTEKYLTGTVNGAVELYHDNTKRFETTSYGAAITGNLGFGDSEKAVFGDGSDLTIYHDGTNSIIKNSVGSLYINAAASEVGAKIVPSGGVELYYNNVKTFDTDPNGILVVGPEGGEGLIKLYADEGDDNADKWKLEADTSGNLSIKDYSSGSWATNIKATGGGTVELYYNDSKKFETINAGIRVSTNNNLYLYDNSSVICGNGNDLQLYHDGSHNYIRGAVAGVDLNIKNNGNFLVTTEQNDNIIRGIKDAQVELYHNDNKKLETTATGVTVTGTLAATAVTGDGSGLTNLPASGGTITATVDGSLSANDAVLVKSTGNVEKVTETISINNPSTFGGARTELGPENQVQSYVQVTSSQKKSALTLYQKGNDSDKGVYYIWAYDGNGGWGFGNWGANKTYYGAGITFYDSCYSPLTNQIFIVSKPWSNNNRFAIGSGRFNDWTGSGGNDEGTDITWNAKTTAIGSNNDQGGNNWARCCCDQALGHFYTVFRDNNDDYLNCYYAASTTSGGVTIESTRSTPNGTTAVGNYVAVGAGNGLVLVAYQNASGNSYLRAGKYDASATGKVTWGSASEVSNQSSSTTGKYYDISYNEGADAFVFVWTDNNVPKVKAVTVNSSSLAITQGANVTIDSNDAEYTSVGYDETTKSNPIAWREDSSGDGFVRNATVSGTTVSLTASTSSSFEDNNVNATEAKKFQIQDMKVYGVSTIAYRQNNKQFGEIRHIASGSSSTNLTTENFIGFSSAAYTNGNTGTINVVSNTTTKSGLTPGQTYYMQRDGSIKTSADSTVGTINAGTSLSSTKLLIKG